MLCYANKTKAKVSGKSTDLPPNFLYNNISVKKLEMHVDTAKDFFEDIMFSLYDNATLESLKIIGKELSDKVMDELFMMFRMNTSIKKLTLSCITGNECVMDWLVMLLEENHSIKELKLASLAGKFKVPTYFNDRLTKLSISTECMTMNDSNSDWIPYLDSNELLQRLPSSIKSLSLFKVGRVSTAVLNRLLSTNTTLEEFALICQVDQIGDISYGLSKNTSLKKLVLNELGSGCFFKTYMPAKYVFKGLMRNTTLTSLTLLGWITYDRSCEIFLRNQVLTHFIFDTDRSDGLNILCRYLSNAKYVKTLGACQWNHVSWPLVKIMETNRSITKIVADSLKEEKNERHAKKVARYLKRNNVTST